MRKNLRFIKLLIKLKLSHMMVFRLSFFGGFFADGMLFLVQVLAFSIIYGQVDGIGDWNRGQMYIFIGTFSMINGLNMAIYFFGLVGISDKIRSGALDMYVTKPINTLFRLTFEGINPGSAPLVLLSGIIIAHGISTAGITVTPALLISYAGMTLLMTLLYYDMELILRTIPFFVISATAIERLEGDMLILNFQIPGILYKGFFKILFYFALPYGIMATVPVQLISGTLTSAGLLHALAIVVIFTAFALWFWKFGLKHYKSASS